MPKCRPIMNMNMYVLLIYMNVGWVNETRTACVVSISNIFSGNHKMFNNFHFSHNNQTFHVTRKISNNVFSKRNLPTPPSKQALDLPFKLPKYDYGYYSPIHQGRLFNY